MRPDAFDEDIGAWEPIVSTKFEGRDTRGQSRLDDVADRGVHGTANPCLSGGASFNEEINVTSPHQHSSSSSAYFSALGRMRKNLLPSAGKRRTASEVSAAGSPMEEATGPGKPPEEATPCPQGKEVRTAQPPCRGASTSVKLKEAFDDTERAEPPPHADAKRSEASAEPEPAKERRGAPAAGRRRRHPRELVLARRGRTSPEEAPPPPGARALATSPRAPRWACAGCDDHREARTAPPPAGEPPGRRAKS